MSELLPVGLFDSPSSSPLKGGAGPFAQQESKSQKPQKPLGEPQEAGEILARAASAPPAVIDDRPSDSPVDPRLADPAYHAYYYSHRRLDPRLPLPQKGHSESTNNAWSFSNGSHVARVASPDVGRSEKINVSGGPRSLTPSLPPHLASSELDHGLNASDDIDDPPHRGISGLYANEFGGPAASIFGSMPWAESSLLSGSHDGVFRPTSDAASLRNVSSSDVYRPPDLEGKQSGELSDNTVQDGAKPPPSVEPVTKHRANNSSDFQPQYQPQQMMYMDDQQKNSGYQMHLAAQQAMWMQQQQSSSQPQQQQRMFYDSVNGAPPAGAAQPPFDPQNPYVQQQLMMMGYGQQFASGMVDPRVMAMMYGNPMMQQQQPAQYTPQGYSQQGPAPTEVPGNSFDDADQAQSPPSPRKAPPADPPKKSNNPKKAPAQQPKRTLAPDASPAAPLSYLHAADKRAAGKATPTRNTPAPQPSRTPSTGNNAPAATAAGAAAAPSAPMSDLLQRFHEVRSSPQRFRLADLKGHVVEFSRDQFGSRFIQQQLEQAAPAEKEIVFEEIVDGALPLMVDVFGNYVVQKLLDHGAPEQKRRLAEKLHGHVEELALQMYGCRVIQKALETITVDQQVALARELDGAVLRCVRDQNGNHVVQKIIERIPSRRIQFIIDGFRGEVVGLATHAYGCRVIQRILEHCHKGAVGPLMNELIEATVRLSRDQYGNYVIQHILQHGDPAHRLAIVRRMRGRFLPLSQHKFASNVMEKCVQYGSTADRNTIITELLAPRTAATPAPARGADPDEPGIITLMKDQFGNYVMQRILDVASVPQRNQILEIVRPHVTMLRRYTYGKHSLGKIEKLTGGRAR